MSQRTRNQAQSDALKNFPAPADYPFMNDENHNPAALHQAAAHTRRCLNI